MGEKLSIEKSFRGAPLRKDAGENQGHDHHNKETFTHGLPKFFDYYQ